MYMHVHTDAYIVQTVYAVYCIYIKKLDTRPHTMEKEGQKLKKISKSGFEKNCFKIPLFSFT
jgi:hypothetical protein